MNMFMYYGVIPLMIQDVNPVKEFLAVKLKPINLGVCLLLIIIDNSHLNSNVTKLMLIPYIAN